MSESKADAEGMADQNGRTNGDRYTSGANRMNPGTARLRTGREESAGDSGSVALNEALAETHAVPGGPPPRHAEPVQPPITIPRGNGLNGNRDLGARAGSNGTIDLVSAVGEASNGRGSPRGAASIINLPNAAAETPIFRSGNGPRPIVGSAGAQPKESASDRVGEAFPERLGDEEAPDPDVAPRIGESAESTLGMYLLASRERHGVKREEAASETRIPTHYLRMMESNDYAMIADQLYLLPFLRRYADYLGLDSEEIAIRFVREVQRAENSPSPASSSLSSTNDVSPSNRWAIMGALAVVALIALWVILQRHHASADATSAAPPSASMPAGLDSSDAGQGATAATASQPLSAAPAANPPDVPTVSAPPNRAPVRATDNVASVPPGGTE